MRGGTEFKRARRCSIAAAISGETSLLLMSLLQLFVVNHMVNNAVERMGEGLIQQEPFWYSMPWRFWVYGRQQVGGFGRIRA